MLLPAVTTVTVALTSLLLELRLPGQIAWSHARPGERTAHGMAFSDPTAGRRALQQVVLTEFLLRAGRPEPAPSRR